MPALTPVAWSSIITGKNPGKHGIFDMTWLKPNTYNFIPANRQLRRGKPFWQYLNQYGVRVGLVNIPFTYPPQPMDGFWVAGFGTPNTVSNAASPPDVLTWLKTTFPNFEPVVEPDILKYAPPADIFQAERTHQATFTDVVSQLVARQPVDVLVINLMLLDHANHKMPDMSMVEQAIRDTDADIGQLMAAFQPDNVMLISDHGSRRVKGDFLLHVWLRDHGYTTQFTRSAEDRRAVLNWIIRQWLHHKGLDGLPEKVIRGVLRRIVPYLPIAPSKKFWQAVEQAIPFAREQLALSSNLDFSRSKAYLGGAYSAVIYLNVAGRQPTGVIPPEDKTAVINNLVAHLKTIQDPDTGQPLFNHVYPASKVFAGGATANAPDIVIDAYNADWNTLGVYRRDIVAERVRNRYFAENYKDFGHHRRDGLFVFSGDDFDHSAETVAGHVMDVPATLLHLYGVPIPEDFDGRVLAEAITPDYMRRHPVQFQPGDEAEPESLGADLYSDDETENLMAHLRALGYVD